jgi:multidrug resistance efflux pump
MKRIAAAHIPYRASGDVRRESVRFGKYIYLAVIGAILLSLFHLAFSHFYLLQGEGVVSSRHDTVALEYDASVRRLNVVDGEMVEPGAPLMEFDSVWFWRTTVDLSTRIAELQRQLSETNIQKARLDATIATASKYADFTGNLEKALRELREKGLVPNARLSTEALRRFEAERDLLAFKAEREQMDQEIQTLKENLARAQSHYVQLVQSFGDGVIRARSRGVVANISATEGAVVTKGQPVMQVFGGERYILAYLDDDSPVSRDPGDPIIVSVPGSAYIMGRISAVTEIADRLPAEFQPKFQRAGRKRLIVISVDGGQLKSVPLMTSVRLYKPIGLEDLWFAMKTTAHAADNLPITDPRCPCHLETMPN